MLRRSPLEFDFSSRQVSLGASPAIGRRVRCNYGSYTNPPSLSPTMQSPGLHELSIYYLHGHVSTQTGGKQTVTARQLHFGFPSQPRF